ncbi:MAG: hypothetical protein RIB78_11775 [Gammaproteobacteria bacterium]
MVNAPEDYPWSSYRHHAWGEIRPLIEDHELYIQLGNNPMARQYAYRELFKTQLEEHNIHDISHASHYNYPLGNNRFKEKIEATLQRRVGYAKRGRPGG